MRNLKRGLEQLENEIKKSEQENEIQKKRLAEELKRLDKRSIFKPKQVEKTYTVWERIMKTLGMN
jgi:hypothetical protein